MYMRAMSRVTYVYIKEGGHGWTLEGGGEEYRGVYDMRTSGASPIVDLDFLFTDS